MLCDDCISSLATYDEDGNDYRCSAWNMPHLSIKPRKQKCSKYWSMFQCQLCDHWKLRENDGGLCCWYCGDGYDRINHMKRLLEEIANIRNPWNSHLKNGMRHVNIQDIGLLRQLQQRYFELLEDQ